MADDPQQLYAVDFTPADQARLGGFSCGDERWARYVTEWILGSDVLDSMSRYRTQVWLFETQTGEIVGYGSLGTTRWKWPLPNGPRTVIAIIPMLGVDRRFHGKPEDSEWRYSRQMIQHLIAEARRIADEWSGEPEEKPQWLVLQVHRDNRRAIKFYENAGFELLPHGERPHDQLAMSLWIGD